MRINARLDEEGEKYLHKIQQIKGFSSITEALKYSLQQAANGLSNESKPGDKMRGFLASGYVGAFEGPENGSVDYKEFLYKELQDKHDIM